MGDRVRRCAPSDAVYERLSYAYREQHGWSVEAHAAFWTALLPELPHRGRPSRVDLLSRAAAALLDDGMAPVEIAQTLGVAPGTIRAARNEAERERPSFALGAALNAEARTGTPAEALLRAAGSGWIPWEALPQVSQEDDEAAPTGYSFNVRIEFDWRPDGLEYAEAAERCLRKRWEARRVGALQHAR